MWRKEGGWQGGSGIVLCPNQQASDISAVKDSLMFCQQCQNHAVKHFWSTIELFIKVSFSSQNGASGSEETKKLALFLTWVKFSLLSKRPGRRRWKLCEAGGYWRTAALSHGANTGTPGQPPGQPASRLHWAGKPSRPDVQPENQWPPTAQLLAQDTRRRRNLIGSCKKEKKKSTEDVYVDKLCFYFPPNNN